MEKTGELSTIKSKLLAEQVEEQIYRYIVDTSLEIGSKLPNEFELGEKFGVGRSTIREAVKLLASKGVLEVRRGSGTYVINKTPADLDPLGLQGLGDRMSLASVSYTHLAALTCAGLKCSLYRPNARAKSRMPVAM